MNFQNKNFNKLISAKNLIAPLYPSIDIKLKDEDNIIV